MGILVLEDTDKHEEEIKEIRKVMKETKSIRMLKRYSVLLRHYE